MKVLVKGVHVKMSNGLKQYVQEHLVDPIEHFYQDEAAEIEIHLCDNNGPKGGEDRECRVTVRMPGSAAIHVNESSDSMHKSIDLVRDRLERLTKREIERKRRPVAHPERTGEALRREVEAELAEVEM
ncbi:MAG: ribosome hibernation-promoting factor, HPF/YfiA family [Myxococcaceae bacterium]